MTKRGRVPRLVESVYNHWPIEAVPDLPNNLRGLYVLYDSDERPLRVGISGKGKQTVRQRMIDDYYRYKYWRAVDNFSVFIFTKGPHFKQAESFVLYAVGKALALNWQGGRMMRTTRMISPPKYVRYPAHFLQKKSDGDGIIRISKKFRHRKVRVEIGPRLPKR